jgi:hypothetical protein
VAYSIVFLLRFCGFIFRQIGNFLFVRSKRITPPLFVFENELLKFDDRSDVFVLPLPGRDDAIRNFGCAKNWNSLITEEIWERSSSVELEPSSAAASHLE